jgi:hypothetical protein
MTKLAGLLLAKTCTWHSPAVGVAQVTHCGGKTSCREDGDVPTFPPLADADAVKVIRIQVRHGL